jgi:hypothetical protein
VIVATIAVDVVSGWVRRRIIEGAGARAGAADVQGLGSPMRMDGDIG